MKKFFAIALSLLAAFVVVGCKKTTKAPAGTTKAPVATTAAPQGSTTKPAQSSATQGTTQAQAGEIELVELVEDTKEHSGLFARGVFNEWGTGAEWELTQVEGEQNKYEITLALSANQEFKFGAAEWETWQSSWIQTEAGGDFEEVSSNIKTKNTGVYHFVVDKSDYKVYATKLNITLDQVTSFTSLEAFLAAADESEVLIKGGVRLFSYSATYGNASFLISSEFGTFYAYRLNMTAEQAALFTEGAEIVFHGYKTSWAGNPELSGTDCEYAFTGDEEVAPQEAVDITSKLADRAYLEGLKMQPAFASLTVKSAAQYKADGSGSAGANCDLYITFTDGTNDLSCVVESDEFAEGTALYNAVLQLKAGDKVKIGLYMYWYNDPNPHLLPQVVVYE